MMKFNFMPLTITVVTSALTLSGCRFPAAGEPGQTPQSASNVNAVSVKDFLKTDILAKYMFAEYYIEPVMSPFIKESVNPNNFQFSKTIFPKNEIAKYQRAGTAATGTPEPLRGIWWMDGNPLADETISFADLDFSQDNPLFSTFAPNNFSFHSGKAPGPGETKGDKFYEEGIHLFAEGIEKAVVYEFNFKDGKKSDFKYAEIKPIVTFKLLGFELRVRIQPGILKFSLENVDQDTFLRKNYLFGVQSKVPEKAGYTLRRILKPSDTNPNELVPTKYWDAYIKAPGPTMLRFSEKNK